MRDALTDAQMERANHHLAEARRQTEAKLAEHETEKRKTYTRFPPGSDYAPRREQRADVLKIMRRMHQRIADGRWSGVPT